MCKVDNIREYYNGQTKIKDFYQAAYPTDELGKDINGNNRGATSWPGCYQQ